MRETRILMGMPIQVAVVDEAVRQQHLDDVFREFAAIDAQFSPFKEDSEVCRFNRGEIGEGDFSPRMREIASLSEKTRRDTGGYFDIRRPDGGIDPSGMVKGWAILNAARQLAAMGFANFCVDAGGDIQCRGVNERGEEWTVGIRNPF